jgi:hypothetical protein
LANLQGSRGLQRRSLKATSRLGFSPLTYPVTTPKLEKDALIESSIPLAQSRAKRKFVVDTNALDIYS